MKVSTGADDEDLPLSDALLLGLLKTGPPRLPYVAIATGGLATAAEPMAGASAAVASSSSEDDESDEEDESSSSSSASSEDESSSEDGNEADGRTDDG